MTPSLSAIRILFSACEFSDEFSIKSERNLEFQSLVLLMTAGYSSNMFISLLCCGFTVRKSGEVNLGVDMREEFADFVSVARIFIGLTLKDSIRLVCDVCFL